MNPVGHPQQYSRFHEPAHGDPVSVKAYGNGYRDKSDGERKMQQVDSRAASGLAARPRVWRLRKMYNAARARANQAVSLVPISSNMI